MLFKELGSVCHIFVLFESRVLVFFPKKLSDDLSGELAFDMVREIFRENQKFSAVRSEEK